MSQGFDPYGSWLGIPPDQRPPNAYALLGLRPGEPDLYSISAAAERAVGRLRPMVGSPQGGLASRLIAEIEGARQMLLDPTQKARYDLQLQGAGNPNAGFQRPAPRAAETPGPGLGYQGAPQPGGMPAQGGYGYPSPPAANWGAAPTLGPPGWSLPTGYPPQYAPQQYAPQAYAQPQYPQPAPGYAPAPSYPGYGQPASAPAAYYPAAPLPTTYAAAGYAPATPPPVAPAKPAVEPESTPEISAPSSARPVPSEAMFWPWMLIGAGGVLAMGLALVWLMQQQNPPAPPVAKSPPSGTGVRRSAPLPAFSPVRTSRSAPSAQESPRKKMGEDGESIPIPGVTATKTDMGQGAEATSTPGATASADGPAPSAIGASPMMSPAGPTTAMPPTSVASGVNPLPAGTPAASPAGMMPAGTPAATPEVKPMVAGADPMTPMTMKPVAGPMVPADPMMKPAAPALAEVPPAVELPAFDESAPAASPVAVRIAPVVLSEKQTLQLALLDGEAAAGQPGARISLSHAGTADAKPSWQADYIDTDNKPSPLGRFTLEDQALRFAWLAGVDPVKAQRLRNVRLAMIVDKEEHRTALRKPAEVTPLVLNLDGLQTKHTLAGLPDADDLGLEIIDQTDGVPTHKIEPAAKVAAGKETDIIFATSGEKPTKLRFRFSLARPSTNQLRVDGRVLLDSGKPQAFKIATLKQNLELLRKQKITVEGEYLEFQKQGRVNRQASQAAADLHRQRSSALEDQIRSLDEFVALCDEVHKKAQFNYRVFMKLRDAEVDLVHGTAAAAVAAK